jgi:hypothetical protein
MKQTPIELEIEELILRDVPSALRPHLAEVIKQELARLLLEQGLPPSLAQGGNVSDIAIGPVRIAEHARAEVVGSQIARSVYGQLWAPQRPD